MKNIFYFLTVILVLGFVACEDERTKVNGDLYQVESITATAGDEQVALEWIPNDKANPQEYYLSWTSGTIGVDGGEKIVEPTITFITINPLVNDVNYTFSIQARYSNGLSGKVSTSATPKNAKFPVTDFMARAGDSKVRLTWKKPATDKLTAYKITVMPGNRIIDINDVSAENYTVDNLTNEQEYTFSIVCVYPQGNSEAVSKSVTPGIISPIIVAETSLVLNQSCTFEYNEMYFNLAEIQSVSWDFGDGTNSAQTSPIHFYRAEGTYTVTVTVTYVNGVTENGSIDMTVTGYLWSSIEVGGYVKVSGVVFSPDGKTIYIPTSTPSGDLVAIDLISGNIKWKYAITTVTYGGGALVDPADGTIYQCGTDSKVYAINPNGTEKWIANVDGVIGAFPALALDGTFYCITNAGTLYALNTASQGSIKWTKSIAEANTGSAIIVDKNGTVYVGSNKGLFAFTADGSDVWSKPSYNVTERGAMAINSSVIYVALKAGAGLAAVNASDGVEKWTSATNGDAYCPIVDKDGIIYFTEKGVSPNFNVYAVNPSDGSKKWSANMGAALTYDGLVLGDNGVVYGGTQGKASGNYKVFGLNTRDGSVAFEETSTTHQIMVGAAIGPDNRLYLGTITTNNIGYLNAYEINAGLEIGSWSVRGGDMFGTNQQK
jgi:outer membrane protein assembly factor BamB